MADREHLYHGKRKDNGEWVISNSIWQVNNYVTCLWFESHWVEVVPETVGEWTDLRDINGERIFKDNILQSRASENPEDWKYWRVEYSDGSYVFTREAVYRKKHKYEENLLCEDEIELYGLVVVGNIHDNGDLFEELKPPISVWDMNLSTRAERVLFFAGVETLQDLSKLTAKDLMQIPRLGVKSRDEIVDKCKSYGVSIPPR